MGKYAYILTETAEYARVQVIGESGTTLTISFGNKLIGISKETIVRAKYYQ